MSGVNLQDYRANPVVLAQHENSLIATVGRTEKIWVEAGEKRGQGVLVARAVFDVDDELGKRVWGKIERGFLRAASVGFVVTRTRLLEEGREDRDTGFTGPVRFATAWRVLEWSVVGVGADPSALGRDCPEPEVEAAGDGCFSLRGSIMMPPAIRLF
jgi:phage head maturation protease